MASIAKDHGVDARPFLAKDLEAEALQLDLFQLQDVLGTVIPEPGLLADANYLAVRDVVEHVLNVAAPIVPEGRLVAPVRREVELNGLTDVVGRLLSSRGSSNKRHNDYFSKRSGTLRQDLRDHLAAIYMNERKDAVAQGLTADTVPFQGPCGNDTQERQHEGRSPTGGFGGDGLLFEACDIFEGPNAAA